MAIYISSEGARCTYSSDADGVRGDGCRDGEDTPQDGRHDGRRRDPLANHLPRLERPAGPVLGARHCPRLLGEGWKAGDEEEMPSGRADKRWGGERMKGGGVTEASELARWTRDGVLSKLPASLLAPPWLGSATTLRRSPATVERQCPCNRPLNPRPPPSAAAPSGAPCPIRSRSPRHPAASSAGEERAADGSGKGKGPDITIGRHFQRSGSVSAQRRAGVTRPAPPALTRSPFSASLPSPPSRGTQKKHRLPSRPSPSPHLPPLPCVP